MKKTIIGITGKIGAGKTSIVKHLATLPAVHVFDADQAINTLYDNPSIQELLISKLGTCNRSDIRQQLVESQDCKLLQSIEYIFRPYFSGTLSQWIRSHHDGLLILDMPLLFESEYYQRCDITIQISTAGSTRRQRLLDRNPATSEIFSIIDAVQYEDLHRSELATFTIHNNINVEHACNEAEKIILPYVPNYGFYAGSFDPVTKGHLDIIEKGTSIFDKLIVGVGVNERKTPLFSDVERMDMIAHETDHLPNLEIVFYNTLLIQAAKAHGARFILRGVRDTNDCMNEIDMHGVNHQLDASISTIFLPCDPQYMYVSSTAAKIICEQKVDVSHIVTDSVALQLHNRIHNVTNTTTVNP